MKLSISPEIFKNFNGLRIGVIVARKCDNQKTDQAITEKLQSQQEMLKRSLNPEKLKQHPAIVAWQEAYRSFGSKPKDYMSSIEKLTKRVLAGNEIRSINPFVDIYNYVSLKYVLPVGGEDLDKVSGDIVLAYAGEHEQAVTLLGEKEARVPYPGEVIYKDNNGAICRRWNWKEAERTKLTTESTNVVFVIEALPCVDSMMLEAGVSELAWNIHALCGGSVGVAILDNKKAEVDLSSITMVDDFDALAKQYAAIAADQAYAFSSVAKTSDVTAASDHEMRLKKVEELRARGIEPWPAFKPVTATCKEVVDSFEATGQSAEYAVAGRLMTIRLHGKAAFAHMQDRSGKVQIYLKQDHIGADQFAFFKEMIDVGDIVWCTGKSFKTKTGEVTLEVTSFTLLSKSLYPLPEKFHGLTDIEVKYRQRYLDLIANPETHDRFIKRSKIIKQLRAYLDAHDFVEVETPMLHPIPGGAAARPFITHHNALDQDLYLRIAPELYLKRLVVGGFERVYEINRNFRNEGVSTRHNPEFTMLEFYMAYQDYHFIMTFIEDMLRSVVRTVCTSLHVPYENYEIDFEKPFTRLGMKQSLITVGGLSEADVVPEAIDATIKKHGVKLAQTNASYGEKVYALFEALVEKKLIQPTFITEYPTEVSPLAKRDWDNPAITARFELFAGGIELSNGFNELNDPFDQADRFKQQVAAHEAGDEEAHRFDKDYIRALEQGLPPTVGVGIGIDRLTMFLTNTPSIKEVILFPTLKRKDD